MKRSEMVDHVEAALGDASNLSASDIIDFLNWSLQDVASLRHWRDMKKWDTSILTAANKTHYGMPENTKDILDVLYLDGSMSRSLVYIRPEIYRKRFPHPGEDGSGYPLYYTWEGNYFRIYPLSTETGKTIEIFRVVWPRQFNSSDDWDCPLPKLDYAIIMQATSYCAHQVREWQIKAEARAEFFRIIKEQAQCDGDPTDWTFSYAGNRLREQLSGEFVHVYPVEGGTTVD